MFGRFAASCGFLRSGPLGPLINGSARFFLRRKIQCGLGAAASLPGLVDEPLFIASLLAVLTQVAMAKGCVSAEESRIVRRFFAKNLRCGVSDLACVDALARRAQTLRLPLETLVEEYKQAAGAHYRSLLPAMAYQMALAAGALPQAQERIIRLCALLEVGADEHNRLRRGYGLEAVRSPYDILGVSAAASAAEIRRAYKRKISQCHPDRAAHLGEETMQRAHRDFLEAQSAYRELERARSGGAEIGLDIRERNG